MERVIDISGRNVGENHPPLVIAEIGINHEGQLAKAVQMVDDAFKAGCECVKFQCHVHEDEMIFNSVIPANADESIWDMMKRCSLTEDEDKDLKALVESKGMIYLSTPFSRAAANRLKKLEVETYKIGSGECNNYPLIEHIASFGRPVILSTGMNDLDSISIAVDILRKTKTPFALMHCTSMYPTPYEKIRLGALSQLNDKFPDAVIGLSDHSYGNYACFAAIALGASIVERHFTSDINWPGPDIPISMTPDELEDLVKGADAIFKARGGDKGVLPEEQPTIDFAYASVVAIKLINKGEKFTRDNIWVKRPGTGEILATDYESILGKESVNDISIDTQIKREDVNK